MLLESYLCDEVEIERHATDCSCLGCGSQRLRLLVVGMDRIVVVARVVGLAYPLAINVDLANDYLSYRRTNSSLRYVSSCYSLKINISTVPN